MLPTCNNVVRIHVRIVQRRCPSSRKWEREYCARETPEQREARLHQRRLRDRERFTCCDAKFSQRKNSRVFAGICCPLRHLTEAVCLSNLRGSKVQVVNRLGWLMQIQSSCARSRWPKTPCIPLLVGERERANLVVRTVRIFYIYSSIYDRTPSNFACSQDYKRASFHPK